MKQNQIDRLSLLDRLLAPTPAFFQRVRAWCVFLAAISVLILASPVCIPVILLTVAKSVAVAASVATAVSQAAVKG